MSYIVCLFVHYVAFGPLCLRCSCLTAAAVYQRGPPEIVTVNERFMRGRQFCRIPSRRPFDLCLKPDIGPIRHFGRCAQAFPTSIMFNPLMYQTCTAAFA